MTANDTAWNRFFSATDALDHIRRTGHFYTTADALKEHGGREPRLMAKLDRLGDRPEVFVAHKLAILPTKNGEYVIFSDPDGRSFFRFSDTHYDAPVSKYTSEVDLFAYDAFPGTTLLNESQAVDFAYISSLLRHFTEDSDIYLTIRGRLYSGQFSFKLPRSEHTAAVNGVQIEVDAGFESATAIYLIEAKTGRREDFHIRQLYYPYLEWSSKSRKTIVPVFLTYTNGKYYLTQFSFGDEFGDLNIVRNECYIVNESPLVNISLTRILEHAEGREEQEAEPRPFPQADDLDKVIDSLARVEQGAVTKYQLAEVFEFAARQGDYYANAAKYMGLLDKLDEQFLVTNLGHRFLNTRSRGQRTRMLVEQLVARPVFRSSLRLLLERNLDPSQIGLNELAAFVEQFTNCGTTTARRRALTVRSWLKWLALNSRLSE